MWADILNGYGASTAFNELGVLIEGLRLLITSRASTVDVTRKHLESHKQAWEK